MSILKQISIGIALCVAATASATEVAGVATGSAEPTAAVSVQAGDVAPDFLGIDKDKHEVRVSQFRGKVLVVTFWASWCGICAKELPVAEAVRRKWGADRVEVVGVNFHEPNEAWRNAMKRLKGFTMTFTRDLDSVSSNAFGVNSLPHIFMIDGSGRVAHVHKGYDESSLPAVVGQMNEMVQRQAAEQAAQ